MSLESASENKKQESKEDIIDNLFAFLKKSRAKEEITDGSDLPSILADLPKDLSNMVTQNFQRFKSYGLTEEQLLAELKHDVELIKFAYEDKRFDIPNGSYFRYEIKNFIDDLVVSYTDQSINIVKIQGFGVINIDVNGLKMINDIIGHEAGTEYLERIVNTLKAGKTTKELEAKGIKVFVSSNGGDEFVIILNDDVNLTELTNGQSFINRFLNKYQDEIKALDISDLVDFNKPEIIAKFENELVPKNFKYIASVSGGTAHIEEVLINNGFSPNARLSYSDNLNFIISSIFQISDRRSKEDKDKFKAELENSDDPHKKFLGALFRRNLP